MSILNIFKTKQKKERLIKPKKEKKQAENSAVVQTEQAESAPSLPLKGSLKEQGFLIKPYFSEKFSLLGEKNNKYIFEVHQRATKNEIKKLLEDIYNVKILKINVLSGSQKTKRWKNKRSSVKENKKMIVTLKEGQKIELGV